MISFVVAKSKNRSKKNRERPRKAERSRRIHETAANVHREFVDVAFADHNIHDLVNKFRLDPFVDAESLLKYCYSLPPIGDFTIYVFTDDANVNKLMIIVHAEESKSKVAFCMIPSSKLGQSSSKIYEIHKGSRDLVKQFMSCVEKYGM